MHGGGGGDVRAGAAQEEEVQDGEGLVGEQRCEEADGDEGECVFRRLPWRGGRAVEDGTVADHCRRGGLACLRLNSFADAPADRAEPPRYFGFMDVVGCRVP